MTKSKQEWEIKARKALREKMLYYPAKPILDDQIDGLRPIVEEVIQKTREVERQRVVEMIESMKNKEHCCESQEGARCEYELALSDFQSKLGENHAK